MNKRTMKLTMRKESMSSKLLSQLTTIQAENCRLSKELSNAIDDKHKLTEDNKDKDKIIIELEKKLNEDNDLLTRFAGKEEELSNYEKTCQKLHQQIDKITEENNTNKEISEKKIQSLENEKRITSQELITLKKKLNQLDEENTTLKSNTVIILQNKIIGLENENNRIKNQVTALSSDCNLLISQNKGLQKEISSFKTAIKNDEKDKIIKNLESKVEDKEKIQSQLKKHIISLEDQIKELENIIELRADPSAVPAAIKRKYKKLQVEYNHTQNENQQLKISNEKLEESLEEYRNLKSHVDKYKNILNEVNDYFNQIKEKDIKIIKLQNAINSLNS